MLRGCGGRKTPVFLTNNFLTNNEYHIMKYKKISSGKYYYQNSGATYSVEEKFNRPLVILDCGSGEELTDTDTALRMDVIQCHREKFNPIRTASDLKYAYSQLSPDGKWFTPNNMRFAGDTMANFYIPVKHGVARILTDKSTQRRYYALQRRRPVRSGMWATVYFDIETLSPMADSSKLDL